MPRSPAEGESDAAGNEQAAAAGGTRPPIGYALRQEKGAYWPLFFPLVSFQLNPRASTWLFNAWARANRFAAGWPVLSRWSGSVTSGLTPMAPSAAMSTNFAAVTDHLTPVRSKRIGADSTPRNFPTKADKAAIGPPADPLAIEVMASRCSALARASAMTPTDQFPLPIASGVNPRMMKPRPSRETVP